MTSMLKYIAAVALSFMIMDADAQAKKDFNLENCMNRAKRYTPPDMALTRLFLRGGKERCPEKQKYFC